MLAVEESSIDRALIDQAVEDLGLAEQWRLVLNSL
jgi:hypothetical protein